MAMVLFYNRINWENYPSVVTPINETNLNKIDYAAKTLDERTVELYNTKADKAVLVNMITDWTLDENTGIITVTKNNGTVINFDLNIEKIPVNFEMSEDGVLKMTTEDGSIFTADIGSMIPIIKFKDSDTISVVPEIDGNEKTYSISVKEGSIVDKYLEPNYLSNIKINSQNAELASTQATESAKNAKSYSVGGTGTREDEDIDNAKYYAEKAKEAAENASAIASVGIMTTEKAGVGKPDGETITADEDGTMRVPSHSDVALNRQTLGYTKKNLLKNTGTTTTKNGVTFTVNDDGSVTVNGTPTATTYVSFNIGSKSLPAGEYIISGCPSGGSKSSYAIEVSVVWAYDLGSGKVFTLNKNSVVYINLIVWAGTTIDNLTFYPMIRSADIVDDTFEPYVDDVDTRLKALTPVNNLLATVPGSPLDAVQGKALNDKIDGLVTNVVGGNNARDLKICSGNANCTFIDGRTTITLPITFLLALPIVNITNNGVFYNSGVEGNILTVECSGLLSTDSRWVKYIVVGY